MYPCRTPMLRAARSHGVEGKARHGRAAEPSREPSGDAEAGEPGQRGQAAERGAAAAAAAVHHAALRCDMLRWCRNLRQPAERGAAVACGTLSVARPAFHVARRFTRGLAFPACCYVQGETPADQNPNEFDEDSVVPLPMGTGAGLGRFAIDEADEGEVDDGGVVGADGLPDAPVDGADSEADSSQPGLQRTCSKVRPPS